jgi:hypothetical protein
MADVAQSEYLADILPVVDLVETLFQECPWTESQTPKKLIEFLSEEIQEVKGKF